MMEIEEIMERSEQLRKELRIALSTMTRKDRIYDLKVELLNIERNCPHLSSKYNYTMVDGHCPYCGKKLF